MIPSLLFPTLLLSPQAVLVSDATNSCQNLLDAEFNPSPSDINMGLCDQKRVFKVYLF